MTFLALSGYTNVKMQRKLLSPDNINIFKKLSPFEQSFLEDLDKKYFFSFQEFKILLSLSFDFNSLDKNLPNLWLREEELCTTNNIKHRKKAILQKLKVILENERLKPLNYSLKQNYQKDSTSLNSFEGSNKNTAAVSDKSKTYLNNKQLKAKYLTSKHTIYGFCPVRSEKTLCCNLRTIDAVLGCGFGCSYCALKSTYREGKLSFHKNFKEQLDNIVLDKNKNYHIGTGQSSDALLWENKDNMLSYLMEFAKNNPNIFLELKSKSDKISFLLENDVPKNVFPSFTLNTETIIQNEEHYTANLDERIAAARKLVERGISIGFHFHPIVIYENWKQEYKDLAARVMKEFKPEDIVFISFGTLHWAKAVYKEIRYSDIKSKILQIPLSQNPEGKLTYEKNLKNEMFSTLNAYFKPWKDKVFFYLCMESREFWENCFDFAYPNNEALENAMLEAFKEKLFAK